MSIPGGAYVGQFADIDRSGDPDYFTRLLARAHSCPGGPEARAAARAKLRLKPGQAVLDAGCGSGDEVVELARITGPGGRAIGLDFSQAMIARARSQPGAATLAVDFVSGDAQRLPFADGTFDACRAGSLLINVADPEGVVAELCRVVKPGGRVVLLDSDNDTLFVDSPYPEITRTVVHSLTDSEYNGAIGRRLRRLLRQQGIADLEIWTGTVLLDFPVTHLFLEGVVARAQEEGRLAQDEVERWWGWLRQADAAGVFTAGKTVFVVAGTRS